MLSKNSERQGRGKCFFGDEIMYEGNWNKNNFSGLGRLIDIRFGRTIVFEGNWSNKGTVFSGTINVDDVIVQQ